MSSLRRVQVDDAASLDKANWLINNQVFELDAIQFDKQRHLLTIPFHVYRLRAPLVAVLVDECLDVVPAGTAAQQVTDCC
jgi:hypothetical protein